MRSGWPFVHWRWMQSERYDLLEATSAAPASRKECPGDHRRLIFLTATDSPTPAASSPEPPLPPFLRRLHGRIPRRAYRHPPPDDPPAPFAGSTPDPLGHLRRPDSFPLPPPLGYTRDLPMDIPPTTSNLRYTVELVTTRAPSRGSLRVYHLPHLKSSHRLSEHQRAHSTEIDGDTVVHAA